MEVGKIAKSDDTRINDEITASSCRLIGVDGSQLGLFAIRDAQRVAASIVQKGKLAACAFALDRQLNNVDFPTLGRPTIPHFNAILFLNV